MALFRTALGDDFERMPPALREFHSGRGGVFSGTAHVERGPSRLANALLDAAGFPPTCADVDCTVSVVPTARGERWVRRFGPYRTASELTISRQSRITERFGVFRCELDPMFRDGVLEVGVSAAWVGPVRAPAGLTPVSTSRETQDDAGAFCFDIRADQPGLGRLIRYHGRLTAM